jgi:hypothetical protein
MGSPEGKLPRHYYGREPIIKIMEARFLLWENPDETIITGTVEKNTTYHNRLARKPVWNQKNI